MISLGNAQIPLKMSGFQWKSRPRRLLGFKSEHKKIKPVGPEGFSFLCLLLNPRQPLARRWGLFSLKD